eukprot:3791379-Pleurochrysis_carterae.AAC.2
MSDSCKAAADLAHILPAPAESLYLRIRAKRARTVGVCEHVFEVVERPLLLDVVDLQVAHLHRGREKR